MKGLKDEEIRVKDVLSESGMDSIITVQFIQQVREKLEIEIPIQLVISHPTFLEFQEKLEEDQCMIQNDWNEITNEIWKNECSFFPNDLSFSIK